MRTIYGERVADDTAKKLCDPNIQLFWVERDPVIGGQRVLRRALEMLGMESREIHLDKCYQTDLEETFRNLPDDRPGVVIIHNYDKSDKFLSDVITFTMLYYEYRKMITQEAEGTYIPCRWKFVITTESRAWIPYPELHKRLCKI